MQSAFAAVIFDLDGTLLDTAPDFVLALNALRKHYDLPALAYDTIRQQVSNGAAALVKLGFDVDPQAPEFAQLRQQLLDQYIGSIGQQTEFFPGIEQLLQELKAAKVPWGIATNKPRLYTEALLNNLQLANTPAITICPDDVEHRKPHPESLHVIAEHLNIDSTSIIYLGDHRRDIECGKQAGSTTIACGYGYVEASDPAESWDAHYLVQDSRQLPELVKHLMTVPRDQ